MSLLDDLYTSQQTTSRDPQVRKLNYQWVFDSFLTPRSKMNATISKWTFYSSADHKFTDSQWGGNFSINARQQWTPMSDPRRIGMMLGRRSGFSVNTNPWLNITDMGMGRMYSEQVDDQVQRVYFRFGLPMYNDLASFLSKMTNSNMVKMAMTGSNNRVSEFIGGALTGGFMIILKPWVGVAMLLGNLVSTFITNKVWSGGNAFYALKSVQFQYWGSVQMMVNEFLVQSEFLRYDGLISGAIGLNDETDKEALRNAIAPGESLSPNAFKILHDTMPDVFTERGGIDVAELINRTARRSNAYMKRLSGNLRRDGQTGTSEAVRYSDAILAMLKRRSTGEGDDDVNSDILYHKEVDILGSPEMTLPQKVFESGPRLLMKLWLSASNSTLYNKTGLSLPSSAGPAASNGEVATDTAAEEPDKIPSSSNPEDDNSNPDVQALLTKDIRTYGTDSTGKQTLSAEELTRIQDGVTTTFDFFMNAGVEYLALDVSYTGAMQEGVSNSVTSAGIGEMLNSVASSGRGVRYSTANMNLGGGIVGDLIGSVVGVVGGLAKGALNWVTADIGGAILDVMGGANVDIPQFWDSSSVQMPTANYTIQLRAGGGDFLSLLKGIYLPLFCILAGAFPQSSGGSSHVNPFYCQVFDKGRLQKNLAMITGLSITRGAGNLGFNEKGMALAIDVNIEVTDLAPIMTIPAYNSMVEPGEPMHSYLLTLASAEIDNQLHGLTRISKSFERYSRYLNTITSSAYISNAIAQTVKGTPFRYVVSPSYAFGLMNEEAMSGIDPSR